MRDDASERGELPASVTDAEDDEFASKVLRDFMVGGKLKTMPARQKKKAVILRYLAARFEPGRRYDEREVNALLQEVHPDFASLRRDLVDARLLARDHGVYWRVDETRVATAG